MEITEKSIAFAFLAWLGDEIFSEKHSNRYVAVYRKFSDDLQGDLGQRSDLDWDTFRATVDAWAARQVSAFLRRKTDERTKVLSLPEGRDPFTGLRRGHRVHALSVNTAAEEVLRQVPGIGASSARKILEQRASHGSFESLEQLVERGCMSAEALQLSRDYLTVSATQSLLDGPTEPSVDFATYVRVRHALQSTQGDSDVRGVGIVELERSVNSRGATRYWEPSRLPRDPVVLSIEEGTTQCKKLLASKHSLLTAPLDSKGYLKLLKRIFPKAAASIWVQAPSLGMLHVRTLRPLLFALADAAARSVDVRVLFDGNYAPGPMESDDVAYLRARNVSCRAYPLAARMHSRVIIVDCEHVICGSHSWSPTSMYHSEELGMYIRAQRLAEQQAERFRLLWNAATPDRQFDLNLFRFWSKATIDKLVRAGIADPRQISSIDAVEGLQPEELNVLRREVRHVIENRLPVPIAHRLAKAGVQDLAANRDASKLDELMESKTKVLESSDVIPIGPFLRSYFREGKTTNG